MRRVVPKGAAVDSELTLRGVFFSETTESPLVFESRDWKIPKPPKDMNFAAECGFPESTALGAAAVAMVPSPDELVMGLMDGRGGLWLFLGCAMSYHLRASLDRIAGMVEDLEGSENLVLIIGLSRTFSAERAGELEDMAITAVSKASAGRYSMRFFSATLTDCGLLSHAFTEEEVAQVLCGKGRGLRAEVSDC